MHLKQILITLGVLLFAGNVTLLAQNTDNSALERFERQLDQIRSQTREQANMDVPVDQRLLIEYGGSLTLSYAAIDDTDFNTHLYNQYQLVGFARLNLDGAHNFFARVSSTYRDFHGGSDSFDSHGDDWEQFKLDRAVYRFDLSRFMSAYKGQAVDTNVIFEGGRQYVHWFNGMVFSGELDGILLTVTHDKLTLKGLAGTSTRRTIDIDSARPNYDTDTHRDYFAGALTYQIDEHHTPYIYGLVQQDHNDTGTYFDSFTLSTTAFDYESWYIGVGSQGSLNDQTLYNIGFVYEGGKSLSSAFDNTSPTTLTPQTREDIAAWAFMANLAYQFKGDNFTRVDGEIILASGDGDRLSGSSAYGGTQSGTKDTAYLAFGSMDTGLAFAPEVTNLMMLRMGVSTFPLINHQTFKRLQVGTNIYLYGKLDKSAPIEETSENHSYLGTEADFFANWQITNDLSMAVRYAIFFAGDGLTNNDDPRNFFYTSFTLAF